MRCVPSLAACSSATRPASAPTRARTTSTSWLPNGSRSESTSRTSSPGTTARLWGKKALMSEHVEFPSNGNTAGGYLAPAKEGAGPGVVVIQEWWGLDQYIKGVCDQLADEGFTALAPDLYHGEAASHTEMDRAAELMNALPPDRAARDMGAAVDFLLGHEAVRGHSVGVVGFCMGGMLALLLAARQGDRIGAV